MAIFDFVSLTIGLLLGMVLMLILIWISYFTRLFLFTYCPTQAPECAGANYYNNPGDALVNNPQLTVDDILFLNNQNEMFYKRVPRTTNCVPGSNQVVYIQYPQYCSFSSTSGNTGIWQETAFNSNIYKPSGFPGPTITTTGNCEPTSGSPVSSGIPLIRWDQNPLPLS